MRASAWWRRVTSPVVLASIVVSLAGGPKAEASRFFVDAAFNDDANEVADTRGITTTVTVPTASNSGVLALVIPNQKYRLEVSGTFVYAPGKDAAGNPGRLADAECSIDPISDPATGRQWQANRWTTAGNDLLDVVVTEAGASTQVPRQWLPIQPYGALSPEGDLQCSRNNTYYMEIVPQLRYLKFLVNDPGNGFKDNSGTLTVSMIRSPFEAQRRYEARDYQCPKWINEDTQAEPGATVGSIAHADMMLDSRRNPFEIPEPGAKDALGNHIHPFNIDSGHDGMYTCNWALTDTYYKVVVDGVWKWETDEGGLALADAECSTAGMEREATWDEPRERNAGPLEFIHDRYNDDLDDADPGNDRDRLDLEINEFKKIDWIPMYPDPNNPKCAGDENHTYYTIYKPAWDGPLLFDIGDWDYEELDNRGMLCIHIEILGIEGGHHAPSNQDSHDVLTVADFMPGMGG